MPDSFQNKTVMITGATGNVGRAVVKRFADQGAKLALIAHRQEQLDKLVTALNLDAANCLSLSVDVTDAAAVDQMTLQILERFGQINILAHTVGGFAAGKPVHESGIEVWERMMALNARSVYLVAGRVARHMVERGSGGKIIAILARNALQGTANASAYSASKAAAQRIIESMGAELRSLGINVNGIMPGNIDTPENRRAMPKADFDSWVTVEDIADAVMFLASDRANAINGASIPIYGCI